MKNQYLMCAAFLVTLACSSPPHSLDTSELASLQIGEFKPAAGNEAWTKMNLSIKNVDAQTTAQSISANQKDFTDGKRSLLEFRVVYGHYTFDLSYENAAGKVIYQSCDKTTVHAINTPVYNAAILVCRSSDNSGAGQTPTQPASDVTITPELGDKTPPMPAQPSPGPEQRPPVTGLASLLSEAQFNQLYPNRNPFYTYQGLVQAADATAGFAKEGSLEDRKRELAAALGNSEHESDHFKATREYNQANWPLYCQGSCTPGLQYYGRGPIQLSWNFNYQAAGQAMGIDLLSNPDLVATDSKIAWQTMMWYWMTQSGPGSMTPHRAIISSQSFGETIRSINGALECNGKNPAQVSARQQYFQNVLRVLNVSAGTGSIGC